MNCSTPAKSTIDSYSASVSASLRPRTELAR